MKHNLPKHTERIRTRHTLNGTPYPDNPKGLPYNNYGVLVEPRLPYIVRQNLK